MQGCQSSEDVWVPAPPVMLSGWSFGASCFLLPCVLLAGGRLPVAHSPFWQGCRGQGSRSRGAGGARYNAVPAGPAVPPPRPAAPGRPPAGGTGQSKPHQPRRRAPARRLPHLLISPAGEPQGPGFWVATRHIGWKMSAWNQPESMFCSISCGSVGDAVFVVRRPSKVLLWNYGLRATGIFAPLCSKKDWILNKNYLKKKKFLFFPFPPPTHNALRNNRLD